MFKSIRELAQHRKAQDRQYVEGVYGEIGLLQADDTYQVFPDATNINEVWVRINGEQSKAVVAINQKVTPKARLPVRMRLNSSRRWEIIDSEPLRNQEFMGEAAGSANLPPLVGDAVDFNLNGEHFRPGMVHPETGANLVFRMEKLVVDALELGGLIDATTVIGTIASGKKAHIVFSVDPTDNTLTATKGTEVGLAFTLDRQAALNVTIPAGDIRLWSYIVVEGATVPPTSRLTPDPDFQFDLRPWISATGGVTSVTATSPLASSGGTTPDISIGSTISDALVALAFKRACRVAAVANVSVSSAPSSIDSITLASGDRVLLTAQSTASENGPWVFNGAGSAMTRPTDYASGNTVQAFFGLLFLVTSGTVYAGSFFYISTTAAITIDTTNVSITRLTLTSNTSLRIIDSAGNVSIIDGSLSAVTVSFPPSGGQLVGVSATQTLTNKTLTTPTIGNFTNATHNHQNAAGGGSLDAAAIGSGTLSNSRVDFAAPGDIGTTTPAKGYFSDLREKIGGFFAIFTHANTADRTYTLPDATTTLVGNNTTDTLTNKTLTQPTIGDLTNANHSHQNAAGGGTLDGAAIAAGTVAAARLGVMTGDSGSGGAKGAAPAPASGDATKYLRGDATYAIPGHKFAVIEDQQTQNTAGGGSTATTWSDRVLNTEVVDADNIVSISANAFTPIAGTYRITVDSPFFSNATNASEVRIRLQNTAGGGSEVIRSNNYHLNVAQGVNARLDTVFTANGSDSYKIQYYITVARITNGLGVAVNETSAAERYTRVVLEKLDS